MSLQTVVNGRPVDPPVRLLMERFPLKRGEEVTYEQIAEVIGDPYGSDRFRTVTAAWRNRVLRDHSINIVSVRNSGFRAQTAEEQVRDESAKGMKSIRRRAARSMDTVLRVSDRLLDEKDRTLRDHAVQSFGSIVSVGDNHRRTVAARDELKKLL